MLTITPNKATGAASVEMLALEAENSNNILQSAIALIPNVITDLKSTATGLLDLSKTFSFSELKSMMELSFSKNEDIPGNVLKNVFVPVPEGFVGKAYEYQVSLAQCINYYEEVTKPLLREFYVTVAAFVTNKDRKLSIKDDTKKFKGFETRRSQISKDINTHFTTANTGRTLFTETYGSYLGFKETYKDNGVLIKRLDQIDLKGVANQVKKITDVLDIAIKAAEQGEYDKASNEALMNMAAGTYEIAQQVEFLAATVYRVKALAFAISETEDKLKNL